MNLHGSYAIGFVVFYQTFTKNKSLCQINLKCLLIFANDASQHLHVLKIHRVIIIDNKKNPQHIESRPWSLKAIDYASMVSSCRTSKFGTFLLAWRCIMLSTSENEDVGRCVWMWGAKAFSSIPPTLSIMQNSASSTIEQIEKMHNVPTHNKQRHIKTH